MKNKYYKALHPTAIPLHLITAGELDRYTYLLRNINEERLGSHSSNSSKG